jgi:hypothetical protein
VGVDPPPIVPGVGDGTGEEVGAGVEVGAVTGTEGVKEIVLEPGWLVLSKYC